MIGVDLAIVYYIGHLGLIGPLGLNFTLLLYFTGKVTNQKKNIFERK